jgi:Tfp pilus assembly protein PilN
MRAVNLLPEHERQGGTPILTTTTAAAGGSIVALVAVVFVAVSFVTSHGKVSDREAQLSSIREQVTEVQARAARSAAEVGQDQARVAAFTTAASARQAWDDLLDDVSRVLPNGSWLTSMNMQGAAATPAPTTGTPAPATTSIPTAFTAAGMATSQNTVAQVMQRLELIPELSNVTLQSSTRTTVGETPAYQFTMSANIRVPEVPS